MLEIKLVRENLELVKTAMQNRGTTVDWEAFQLHDGRRKTVLAELEELRRQRNLVSDQVARMKRSGENADAIIEKMRDVSTTVKNLEKELTASESVIAEMIMAMPNLPHQSVPVGKNEADNPVVKTVGEPTNFSYAPLPHWTLGENLGILDFNRAAKIAGARFPLYLGVGARLERALINFMLDLHTIEHGYKEVLPPFIVNRKTMTGTGQLPKFEADLFKLDGLDYFLIPTAEVPVTNIHQEEVLDAALLPIYYTAYTPCFRSEAGSYGKDTRGLIRQHQFNKVELVKFSRPESSYDELETLLDNAETVLRRLELPYRVITLCTGDLGFSAAKTYDIEVWMPAQGVYREISSCSNFEDFQARRAGIRFKEKGKKGTRLVHTLNGSGLAVGRTLAALLENCQQEDGSVVIPNALRPFMGEMEKDSLVKLDQFPEAIRPHLIPQPGGELIYRCLGCQSEHGIASLLYTCPDCGKVLLLHDRRFDRLKAIDGETWRQIFDYRRMLKIPAVKGIYRYHEFIGPVIPLDAVVYLGEGHTPVVEANGILQEKAGMRFFFKNDGQNPSASFKDRGMASALSYINFLVQQGQIDEVLSICASTGDTSAAAALYAAYLKPHIKSAVLLPHKKVTPQQLSQPLGSGADVFEIPGVFDDCMKVVEALSEQYHVALLNSKNAWRILGQESYSYEIAQDFDYVMADMVVVVPIGNAGNITAVMNGFLKFFDIGVIDSLPKIIGVQSVHANPVYQYYSQPEAGGREFVPMTVKPSVAQAAMIGNPVSMPRVIHLVDRYNQAAGRPRVHFVEVAEQDIMDWQLIANRNGHIACTHGGESLAGLRRALDNGFVTSAETAVVDSTAHALKFSGFQDMYFQSSFPDGYAVSSNPALVNQPQYIHPKHLKQVPAPGKPLDGEAFAAFVDAVSRQIAATLGLKKKI